MTKVKKQTYLKGLFGIATLGIIAYSTGVLSVLGGFWRIVFPDITTPTSDYSTFGYGYGYGSLGYGYGYGYGYSAFSGAGYYYSPASTGSAAFSNPTVVTAADMPSVSIIVGTPTAATSITITTPVQFEAAGGVRVVLPAGLVITSASGTMNTTQLGAYLLSTLSHSVSADQTSIGAISFGIPGIKLNFSRPILIQIPLGTHYLTTYVQAFHAGDSAYSTSSLTNNSSSTCTNGVASPSSNALTESGSVGIIYTCSASDFVAYTSTSSSSSSGGGGGGGGGYSSSSSSSTTSTGHYTQPSTGDIEKFEEAIKSLEVTSQQKMVNGQEVTIKIPTFKSEDVNKVVSVLTTKILEAATERKITGTDLETYIDSYNKFLAALKLYKDVDASASNLNIARMYVKQLVGILNQYPVITVSKTLQDPEFEYALAFMKKNGLTKYASVDEYRPFDSIQRQEAAKFFVAFGKNVLGLQADTSKECNFSDLTGADSTLTSYITEACQMGIMKGSNGTFRPFAPMSKGESITVLIRAISGESLDETVEPWFKNYFVEAQKLALTKETDVNKLWLNLSRYEAGLLLYRSASK